MATAAPVHKSVFSALILSMYVTVRVVSPGCGCGFALEFAVAAGLGIEKALSKSLPPLLDFFDRKPPSHAPHTLE